jgi:hypothetical protein
MSMGIAIPIQFIEGKNNVWVLGLYALIFGFSLPALVGRWWFGNQKKTKDGVNAKTAASFFLSVKEEWGIDELIGVLGKGLAKELELGSGSANELKELEAKVREGLGEKWGTLAGAAGARESKDAKRAFIFLSAHLLRIPLTNQSLRDGAPNVNLECVPRTDGVNSRANKDPIAVSPGPELSSKHLPIAELVKSIVGGYSTQRPLDTSCAPSSEGGQRVRQGLAQVLPAPGYLSGRD